MAVVDRVTLVNSDLKAPVCPSSRRRFGSRLRSWNAPRRTRRSVISSIPTES